MINRTIGFKVSFTLLNDNIFFNFFVSDLCIGRNYGYDTIIRAIEEWFIRKTATRADKIFKNTFKRTIGNHDHHPFTFMKKRKKHRFLDKNSTFEVRKQ